MPMFYTPKPRQFHYDPRFYNPEKEKWEALKKKYADQSGKETSDKTTDASDDTSAELAYFQQRVRSLDREESRQNSRLGWKDLFRKREMPTFNYQPRFQGNANDDSVSEDITPKRAPVKIKRRFDIESSEYMKPVSGGKILLYVGIVLMLLYWILF